MPVLNISNAVINRNSNNIWDRNPIPNMSDIIKWLDENVGKLHGSGEDGVYKIGSGWEIYRTGITGEDWGGYSEVKWFVDITDETKATLFALKWIS